MIEILTNITPYDSFLEAINRDECYLDPFIKTLNEYEKMVSKENNIISREAMTAALERNPSARLQSAKIVAPDDVFYENVKTLVDHSLQANGTMIEWTIE